MEDVMTAAQAAEVLGITQSGVNYLARVGKLPAAYKGPHRVSPRLFKTEDVYALKARREISTTKAAS